MQTIIQTDTPSPLKLIVILAVTLFYFSTFSSWSMAAEGLSASTGSDQVTSTSTLPELQQLAGLENPSLAYGLSGIVDYNSQLKFIDIMKHARPWIGHERRRWGGLRFEELRDGGHLDENGWPKRIPPGIEKLTAVFSWMDNGVGVADNRAGRYVLTYEGTGEIRVSNVKRIDRGRNRLVFDVPPFPGNWMIAIYSTDLKNTGDYIRNIRVIREDHLELYDAGAIFDPQWLSMISDARQIRFMDMMDTNDSTKSEAKDLIGPSYFSWVKQAPLEVMVRLANEVGADPWFTIPHLADDEYVRTFAKYVRDNLDPELKAYVEFSNEAWNWGFRQTHHLVDSGKKLWGNGQVGVYYTKRATEVMHIWEEVYAADAPTRLVKVLAGQTANTWLSDILLKAELWKRLDPDNWVAPSETFDAFAVTSYFGGALSRYPELRDSLMAMPREKSFPAMKDNLMDENQERGTLPLTVRNLRTQRAKAQEQGLDLILYEGGQHHHHTERGASKNEEYNDFMIHFVRSQEMADLYSQLWPVVKEHIDGPFMQFVEASPPSKYGSWGIRVNSLDEVSRAVLIDELNQKTPGWWGDPGGKHLQQGITVTGTGDNDTLIGTIEEDYLLGSTGDDTIYPGPGNDGVNGGSGSDTVLLQGTAEQYSVTQSGVGFNVSGPDGLDYLYDVEALKFENGEVTSLVQ